MSVPRMLPAVVVAFLDGALLALQLVAPDLLVGAGVAISDLGAALALLAVLGALPSPVGCAAAGYLWGRSADVPGRALSFVGAVAVAVAVGFLGTYVVGMLVAAVIDPGAVGGLLGGVMTDLPFALELLSVPAVAFAGAAAGQFRRESGESNTAPA